MLFVVMSIRWLRGLTSKVQKAEINPAKETEAALLAVITTLATLR